MNALFCFNILTKVFPALNSFKQEYHGIMFAIYKKRDKREVKHAVWKAVVNLIFCLCKQHGEMEMDKNSEQNDKWSQIHLQ